MSDVKAPELRLFIVRLATHEDRLVSGHSVDLFEGALRFHDWIPIPGAREEEPSLQAMNRRGFAAGTWVEYEEVTGQQSKTVN